MEAIDALKQKILSLAIQGKLVPQDPNEEPASELLKKIKAEKAELVKQGKIKKDKQESHIFKGDDNKYYEQIGTETKDITDEIPFEIPNNWEWVRLGNYVPIITDYVANGSFASLRENVKIYKTENYALMVKTADFSNNFTESLTYTDKEGYEFLEKSSLYGGELLLSNIGSIGKVFLVPYFNRPMTLASNSIMIKCFDKNEYPWLYEYFLSPEGYSALLHISTGSTMPKFNKTDLRNVVIPVPSMSEQKRIVSVIEKIFNQIEVVKENQEELSKLKDGLKNKILDLAIQGKLVEQDPNDEPASELLKKIKAEKAELVKQGKIKKDKQESYIFKGDDNRHYEQIGSETKDITDEIPFDIPNNWAWFRLENVCQLITKGSSPKWQGIKYVTNDGVLFITSENVGVKNIILKEKKYVEKKFNEIEPRSILKYNDILMNIVGASIGRTALYSINEIANINQAVCLIRLLDSIKNQFFIEYLLYFLNSSICLKYMEDKKVDCARANLSMGNISNFLIPLPPIKEQERITTKLNDIINIIKVL